MSNMHSEALAEDLLQFYHTLLHAQRSQAKHDRPSVSYISEQVSKQLCSLDCNTYSHDQRHTDHPNHRALQKSRLT